MSGCPPYFAPMKYYQMEDLNDVIMDFPKMKIVIEHMGYPKCDDLFVLMANSDRIYTDMSMQYDREMTMAWLLVKAREYGVLNKIMFATILLLLIIILFLVPSGGNKRIYRKDTHRL